LDNKLLVAVLVIADQKHRFSSCSRYFLQLTGKS
jgi:hypothetical protein